MTPWLFGLVTQVQAFRSRLLSSSLVWLLCDDRPCRAPNVQAYAKKVETRCHEHYIPAAEESQTEVSLQLRKGAGKPQGGRT